jgi:hypothetical protein
LIKHRPIFKNEMINEITSLLVDRISNANKRFRGQDIDDTSNDADINLSCKVNIIANANDINAQTKIIEESSNVTGRC